jgi:phosphatidylserine/phosphatidylglycerophosphate/cardiolipin synthase-like enzyme
VRDREIYERVILDMVPSATSFLWIATADIKDLHVGRGGRRMVPFLQVLSELIEQGVAIRLVHAREPGPAFRKDFDRYPNLIDGLERMLCPRVHFKCVVVDGKKAWTGSANLTGAGMGAKSPRKRNFETGILTTEPSLIGGIMEQFDAVWMGKYCEECQRTGFCGDRPDL